MQNDLVPQKLRISLNQFLQYIENLDKQPMTNCPCCSSNQIKLIRNTPLTYRCKSCTKYFNHLTGTPFNRLTPISWFSEIVKARINRQSYTAIADTLGCSVKMITARDKAIIKTMQKSSPALYQWYLNHNDSAKQYALHDLPKIVRLEHSALKKKLSSILSATKAPCIYCNTRDTIKISTRTAFRCNKCRTSFNLLVGTRISRLRDAEKWLDFIDMLVEKQTLPIIAEKLDFDIGTITNWRRIWCTTMLQWGFDSLAKWCQRNGENEF